MNTKTLLTIAILTLPAILFAQKSTELGAFVGVSQYQGDLAPSPIAANETHLAVGGLYRYLFNSNFGLRGTVTWGRISGDDHNRIDYKPGGRSWQMHANILEFAVHSEWNFLGTNRYDNTGLFSPHYSPFVAIGVGGAFVNTTLLVPAEDRYKIPEPKATSTFLVVPISAGLRLDISEDFLITAEFGSRATFSDYLDGISINGNPKAKDWYFFAGLGFVYVMQEKVGSKEGR